MPQYRKGSLKVKSTNEGWIIVEKKTGVRVPGTQEFPVGQLNAAQAAVKTLENAG